MSGISQLGWQVGRLFHTRGPAAANERSLRRVLVHCARHVSMSDERSRRRPVTDTNRRQVRMQETVKFITYLE